jgi:transposase
LTDEERQTLQQLVAGPRVARDKALRARLLLKAEVDGPGWSDRQSADAFAVGVSTIHRVRQRLVEDGLEAALHRQPLAHTKPRTLDGAQEARLVAIAWSQAPAGRTSWTLHLLAEQLVALAIVDAICLEPVRNTRKKTTASPG